MYATPMYATNAHITYARRGMYFCEVILADRVWLGLVVRAHIATCVFLYLCAIYALCAQCIYFLWGILKMCVTCCATAFNYISTQLHTHTLSRSHGACCTRTAPRLNTVRLHENKTCRPTSQPTEREMSIIRVSFCQHAATQS